MARHKPLMFHRTQPDSDATPTLPLGLLAAAGFLSAAGARVVDPLLSLMAHDFSTTVPAVSVIIAAFTLPYGLNQLLLGPLGDRYGKLRVMLGALIGYTVFTTLCATASGLPSLTLLRACAGASSAGLIPVCLAYIGDAVPYEMRKITLSRFATGVVLAQIMAGPLGGAIGEFVGWRGVFLLLGSVGVVVAATLAVRMRALPDRRNGRAVSGAAYRALLARSDARMLLLVTTAEGALTGGVFPFVAPYLHAKYQLSYAVTGLVLACFGIGAFLFTRVARFIVPRTDDASLVLGGGLLIAAVILMAFGSGHWVYFVPAQMVIGFGYYMMHTVLQSRATELMPDARSTAVAAFVFVLFLGQALGALAFAAAIANWGYRAAFCGAALCMMSLGFWLWSLVRRHPAMVQTA
jgi:predicted MFS family arabinose efflux permease